MRHTFDQAARMADTLGAGAALYLGELAAVGTADPDRDLAEALADGLQPSDIEKTRQRAVRMLRAADIAEARFAKDHA